MPRGKIIFAVLCLLALAEAWFWAVSLRAPAVTGSQATTFWPVESIDTVKYSRDLARQEATDEGFSQVIDQQMAQIASVGATHVALGTPYDEEFAPFLERWVASARAHGLHV